MTGVFAPEQVDHFLCHYSSQKFAGVVEELMARAGLSIPRERWYSNLTTRGNTGAASIFIMLADFMRERELQPGQRILCFVPESASLHGCLHDARSREERCAQRCRTTRRSKLLPPHDPACAGAPQLRTLLTELASIWHDYRSRAWRTTMIRKITTGRFTPADYVRWMACWIPQVREGSQWMRTGAEHLDERHGALAQLVRKHAGEEQFDYKILFDDYRRAGGDAPSIDALVRNPGGEALNAYMHALSRQPNPIGLLGAIYIIEGTGQRIIPALLPLLRKQLDIPEQAFRFLAYHGENDASHLARWLTAVEIALGARPRRRSGTDRRRRALDRRAVPAADGARPMSAVPNS